VLSRSNCRAGRPRRFALAGSKAHHSTPGSTYAAGWRTPLLVSASLRRRMVSKVHSRSRACVREEIVFE
jgi:hypothetical protein